MRVSSPVLQRWLRSDCKHCRSIALAQQAIFPLLVGYCLLRTHSVCSAPELFLNALWECFCNVPC